MEEQKNIPELRFPGFDGEWVQKRLGDIFSISAGGDIQQENVNHTKTEIFKYPIYANAEKDKGLYGYADIYKVEEGVVTVAGRGVNIGIAHARNHKFYPIVRLLVLKPKNSEDIYFFEYQINKINLFKESTGVPQLTAPQVSNYKIFYPLISEQQKIASFFTDIDMKISQLKQKKTLLEQYKNGVMQKIFSQNIRFRDENGQEFPKWEKKRLGSFLIERNTQAPKSEEYPLMAFVANKGVAHKGERYNREFLVNDGNNKKYKQTEYGDFIYSSNNLETGSIGMNSFGSASISPVYSIFQIGESCDSQFLYSFLVRKSFIKKMTKYRQGVVYGQWRIHEADFLKIEERIPSIEEQTKIANFLSAIDIKINHTQTQIENAERWKKGLLQKMFV